MADIWKSEEEYLRIQAYWICCPICDEIRCVGRENCEEIKRFVDTRTPKEQSEKE